MSKRNIFGAVIAFIAILYVVYAGFSKLIQKVSELLGINFTEITSVIMIVSVFSFVYMIVKERGRIVEIFKAGLFSLIQYILLKLVYVNLYSIALAKTGIDPRIVLGFLILFLPFIMAIPWFLAWNAIKIDSDAGKGYAIISIVGSIAIIGSLFIQPYYLFEHDTKTPVSIEMSSADNASYKIAWDDEKKLKYDDYYAKLQGEYYVLTHKKDRSKVYLMDKKGTDIIKPTFFILRDSEEEIIDHSYSPGISKKYGKRLVAGTPEDVEDVEKFLEKNSSLSYFYKRRNEKGQDSVNTSSEIIDYIVYNPGKPKVFDLAPYQESDLYVRLGDETMFGHVSRPKNNFGIRFRSGKVVKLWKGEKIPKNIKEDFKVFANDEKVKVGLAFHPYDAKLLAQN